MGLVWEPVLTNEKSPTFVCLKSHAVCFLGGCKIIPLASVKIRVSPQFGAARICSKSMSWPGDLLMSPDRTEEITERSPMKR